MNRKDIKALFDKFGASISEDDVWQVQSATVIKHKALERLAAAARIEFQTPHMIRADRDEAVILVTGTLGDRVEWSIGEAVVNVNYRVTGKMAAYVYAMAEKRAKDRVIIKLAGLHGLYSEDEADEFKPGNSTPAAEEKASAFDTARRHIMSATDQTALGQWWRTSKDGLRNVVAEDEYRDLIALVKQRGQELAPPAPAKQEVAA